MIHFSRMMILLVALSFGTASAATKELTADELRALQGKMKASDYLSVDFVQTSYTALRGKSRTRSGKAQFAKPNRFRWMLETPVKEYKLFNGNEFFDFSPDQNSAVRYEPSGQNARELKQVVDLVMNFDTLLTRYDLQKAVEDGDLVKIELTPKAKSEVASAEVRYSTKGEYITYVRLNLHSKNHLTHEFSNPHREAIDKARFDLPKGVKVTSMN